MLKCFTEYVLLKDMLECFVNCTIHCEITSFKPTHLRSKISATLLENNILVVCMEERGITDRRYQKDII